MHSEMGEIFFLFHFILSFLSRILIERLLQHLIVLALFGSYPFGVVLLDYF